jgi:hypothetical protein
MRRSTVLLIVVFSGWFAHAADPGGGLNQLVVWLIPSEPATPDAGIGGTSDCENDTNQTGTLPQRIEEEIAHFNAEMAQTRVAVINTQDRFKAQLIDWSPEMAVPNWVWVRSQRATLKALSEFANSHKIYIRVRFITWDRALSDLTATWEGHNAYEAPDVVQIGSTWAGYFPNKHLLMSNADGKRKGWEDVGRGRASVLPYVNDTHLIFYWKRLPGAPISSSTFELNSDSWAAIVESLRTAKGGGPPFVFPIGLTLNLLHDYSPLVWAGGGSLLPQRFLLGSRLDLTSAAAFSAPKYLAENSVIQENGRPRRLIAYPEASHEEVSRSFVRGLYRATIEPANFIGRWKRDFNCRYPDGTSSATFWKYAGVAIPPSPFRGGSYLAVWAHTSSPGAAFDLAEFLTTDDAYTRMLGVSGYLPARRPGGGVDLFLGDADTSGEARDFGTLVQQALNPKVGRSYPPIPEFSAVLESREVLERLQIAWRRLSEGDPASLRTALGEVETYVNRQIYEPSRIYSSFVNISSVTAPALAVFLLLLYMINRRRISALNQVVRVRGFSAAGALLFETVHGVFRNPSAAAGTTQREATKSAMIVAALQGWRRGRDETNWKVGPLGDVIWRSIVLAFDSAVCLGIFKEWEASTVSARDFLQIWLSEVSDQRTASARELSLEVSYPRGRLIHMPFMLEQALVCLLQNSLKILLNPDFEGELPKRISIRVEGDTLIIWNPGPPLGLGLCEAINKSESPEEFEQRIAELLTHPGAGTPGFGLVEAYCVLSQCFGGLRVRYDEPRFEVGLRQQTWLHRVFKSRSREDTVTFDVSEKRDHSEDASA